jgi:hypothetical protein
MANARDCKPPEPDAASTAIRVLNEQYIDATRISNAETRARGWTVAGRSYQRSSPG